MKSDKSNPVSGLSSRQKATAGIFVVVIIFLVWQVMALFRGNGGDVTSAPVINPNTANMQTAAMVTPRQEASPKQKQPMTEMEMALLQRQQQLESQYIAALNELQVLKVSKEIAEANQAIAKAKYETVSAQKNIVTLLAPTPIPPSSYAQALTNPTGQSAPTQPQVVQPTRVNSANSNQQNEVNYMVISVSQLQNKWSAVVGYQGSLFQVTVGDVLPSDQSTVIAIDNSGIVIEKEGVKRKLSLVSII